MLLIYVANKKRASEQALRLEKLSDQIYTKNLKSSKFQVKLGTNCNCLQKGAKSQQIER